MKDGLDVEGLLTHHKECPILLHLFDRRAVLLKRHERMCRKDTTGGNRRHADPWKTTGGGATEGAMLKTDRVVDRKKLPRR